MGGKRKGVNTKKEAKDLKPVVLFTKTMLGVLYNADWDEQARFWKDTNS